MNLPYENQSLNKLRTITEFLKLSEKFFLQNYNLKIFVDFLHSDPEISIIIETLLSHYQHVDEKLSNLQTFENCKFTN